MEGNLWIIVVAGLALALALGGWAWWRHHAAMLEMQRRLAWNEQSRLDLECQTQGLNLKLESMAQTLKMLKSAEGTQQLAATSLLARSHLSADAPEAASNRVWKETEPMSMHSDGFAHTLPLELTAEDNQTATEPVRR